MMHNVIAIKVNFLVFMIEYITFNALWFIIYSFLLHHQRTKKPQILVMNIINIAIIDLIIFIALLILIPIRKPTVPARSIKTTIIGNDNISILP